MLAATSFCSEDIYVRSDDHGHAEVDKKVLCQVLGELYLPETVDDDKIRTSTLQRLYSTLLFSLSKSLCDTHACPAAPAHPRHLCTQCTHRIRHKNQ